MSEQRRSIVVNGHEYASVDEMPPEIRERYEKALQLAAEEPAPPGATPLPSSSGRAYVNVNSVTTRTKYVVNGQEYASLDDVPPELAEAIRPAAPVEARATGAGPEAAAPIGKAKPTSSPSPTPKVAGPRFGTGDLRVRVRISPLRLALWAFAILLILYFYLRRH